MEREVISVPCSLANALAILKREKSKAPHKRAYIHLKINVYPVTSMSILFKNE